MNKQLSHSFKVGMLWNSIRVCFQIMISAVSLFITAKIMISPESYGEYSYYLTISMIFVTIAKLGYDIPALRSIGEEKDEKISNSKAFGFLIFYSKLFILISPILIIVLLIFSQLGLIHNLDIKLLLNMVILYFLTWINSISTNILMGLKKYKAYNITIIIPSILFAIVEVFVYVYGEKLTSYEMIGLKIFSLVVAAIIVIAIFRTILTNIDRNYKIQPTEYKKQARSVFLIQINDLIVWDKSEMFFMQKYNQKFDMGIYSFAYQIVSSISGVITGVFSNLFIVNFSEIIKEDEYEAKKLYVQSVKLIMGFSTLMFSMGMILINFIINSWLSQYTYAIIPMYILCFGKIFSSIGSVGSALIHVKNQSKYMAYNSYFIAFFNILLDFVLIKNFGYMGAVIANTLSQIIGMVLGNRLILKLGYSIPFKDLIIFLISFAVFAFSHNISIIMQILVLIIMAISYYFLNFNILNSLIIKLLNKISKH